MEWVKGHPGLYVGRVPDNRLLLWNDTTAVRTPLEIVERSWRGIVMDTYALEKLERWTPELSPPADSPFFRWRVLAAMRPVTVALAAGDRDKRQAQAKEENAGEENAGSARHGGGAGLRSGAAG